MKMSKQNQALLASLFILLVIIGVIYFVEDMMFKIIVAVVGLIVLWFVLRIIFKTKDRVKIKTQDYTLLAQQMIPVLGGVDNIEKIDYCQTRILLTVKDSSTVNVDSIRELGIMGVIKPSNTKVQLIVKELVNPIYNALIKVVKND